METVYSSVSVSGTVIPTVFNRLTGYAELARGFHLLNVKSPFSRRNLKAMIIEGIDTRRDNRTTATYQKMMPIIEQVIRATPKNVGIFCASYRVLQGLVEAGLQGLVTRNRRAFFSEKPGMSSADNHDLVQRFKAASQGNGGVLLGVCGGRNSEGEDFPGDYMNAVIVVGIPFHQPTPRIDAKIKYYDRVFSGQGWTYAYLVPAIERSNQACGRPVRLITDKAAIVLLDDRFKQRAHWLSGWIKDVLEVLPNEPGTIFEEIRDLFRETGAPNQAGK
jgi:DNA excision repair protein ERCC-2